MSKLMVCPDYIKCWRCKERKPNSEFYNNRSNIFPYSFGKAKYCKDCARLRMQGNETYRLKKLRYRKRYPEKLKARTSLKRAVQRGVLTRPNTCSSCNQECKPHGHHPDYNKPLDVVWLCNTCHLKLHGTMN